MQLLFLHLQISDHLAILSPHSWLLSQGVLDTMEITACLIRSYTLPTIDDLRLAEPAWYLDLTLTQDLHFLGRIELARNRELVDLPLLALFYLLAQVRVEVLTFLVLGRKYDIATILLLL